MKKCSKCGISQSLNSFKGLSLWCILCRRAYRKAWHAIPENKERDRISHNKWYKANAEKVHKRNVARWRIRQYNITESQYEAMKIAQNNTCAICKKEDIGRQLCIDHDHVTGKIRGLLCRRCNSALGYLYDDTDIIKAMLNYIEFYK